MNDALVEVGAGHTWSGLDFSEAHGVKHTGIIDAPCEERRPQFRRETKEMVKLDAVAVGKPSFQ
jgi:hypothetical protein